MIEADCWTSVGHIFGALLFSQQRPLYHLIEGSGQRTQWWMPQKVKEGLCTAQSKFRDTT